MQVRDLCMWEMSCHFSPAFIKKLNQRGIDLLHMLIFPVDLPNPLDGALQTLLVLFGIAKWVYLAFQVLSSPDTIKFSAFQEN